MPIPGEPQNGERRYRCRREDDAQRGARLFLASQQPRELKLEEFEIIADRVQVAAGFVDLLQRERDPACIGCIII